MIPAYGKELLQARRNGLKPELMVWVTDDWNIASEARLIVSLGHDYDLEEMLRGLDVIITFKNEYIDDSWFKFLKWKYRLIRHLNKFCNVYDIPYEYIP